MAINSLSVTIDSFIHEQKCQMFDAEKVHLFLRTYYKIQYI